MGIMDKQLEQLEIHLESLQNGDPDIRLSAARALSRLARGNWTKFRGDALTDPATLSQLLDSTQDVDWRVQVDVINAVGNVSQRYKCMKPEIRDCLMQMFESSCDAVKIQIAAAIPQYHTADVLNTILLALDCRPKRKARHAVALGVARYAKDMRSTKMKLVIAERLMAEVIDEADNDTVDTMMLAIATLGPPNLLEWRKPLNKRLKKLLDARMV